MVLHLVSSTPLSFPLLLQVKGGGTGRIGKDRELLGSLPGPNLSQEPLAWYLVPRFAPRNDPGNLWSFPTRPGPPPLTCSNDGKERGG